MRQAVLGPAAACLILALARPAAGDPVAADRPVIAAASALPRSTYRLPQAPSAAIADRATMTWLALEVERAGADMIQRFDIRDPATVRGLYDARRVAALVLGDFAAARRWTDAMAAADDRPGSGIAADLLVTGLAAVRARPRSEREREFGAAVRTRLGELDSSTRSRIVELRRDLALASSAYRLGEIAAYADPQWRGDPAVGQDFAVAMLRLWVEINLRNPLADVLQGELLRWLAAHPQTGSDVWTKLDLNLSHEAAIHPVTIAVWDSVDPSVFARQIVRETGDVPNGRDDDGDAFVDEAEGLAFDERFAPVAGSLAPVPPEMRAHLRDYERYMRGTGDLAAGLDTPAARFAQAWRRRLRVEDVEQFEEGYRFYTNYIHGTHVAGIALRGLPAATVVPVRISFSDAAVPPLLDEAAAEAFVAMTRTSVRYMRSRGVRVCNISWGYTALDIEANLAANHVEPDPAARVRRAQAIFDVMFGGMTQIIAEAPEILFVVAAGNARQDIDFVRDLPGSINLPNVLTVGAADRSGAAASFASTGNSVDLYANGTNIESRVPGGGVIRWSGASLAAPQVVNAAAKLLSLRPGVSSERLARLLKANARAGVHGGLPLLDAAAVRRALAAAGD